MNMNGTLQDCQKCFLTRKFIRSRQAMFQMKVAHLKRPNCYFYLLLGYFSHQEVFSSLLKDKNMAEYQSQGEIAKMISLLRIGVKSHKTSSFSKYRRKAYSWLFQQGYQFKRKLKRPPAVKRENFMSKHHLQDQK